MKRRFFSFSAAAAFALLLTGCSLLNSNEQQSAVKDSKTHYAADAVKPFVDSGELPGAISILCKGDLQETACLGWADLDKKLPIATDQIFMQASQTKGFCGVTIAMLVEEGKISLDDPVSKYLPEFKELKVAGKDKDGKKTLTPAKNVLTIRMVMNHTGGFPFEIPTKRKKGWPSISLRETAKEAASLPLQFEPGTKVLYSNTGIDIGAAVIEAVTGKTWDVFLQERVLDPLGMKDTSFRPTDEQLSRRISMYLINPGQKPKLVKSRSCMPAPHNGPGVHPSAGAGLWTTAADQVKFYRMLMNLGVGDNGVRLLKEETVKNLLGTSSRPPKMGQYSLGLVVNSKKGTISHGGAWKTKCTVIWKKKELSLWVVQLAGKYGTVFPWDKPWNKAVGKFFNSKFDDSETQAYTGRLK